MSRESGADTSAPREAAMAAPPGCPAHRAPVPFDSPRFHTDPTEFYRDLRHSHGPVVPVTFSGGVPAWLVIGYHELQQVTTDPELYSRDSLLWNQWPHLPPGWELPPRLEWQQTSMVGDTGERHQRRAAMVSTALSSTEPLTPGRHAGAAADRLIDAFCSTGHADLVSAYTQQLPARVLARLLGFSEAAGPTVAHYLNELADGGAAAPAARRHLLATLSALVAARRAEPAADIATWMLAHEPAEFTDAEIVEDLLVIAEGHRAAADWIASTVRLILTERRFADAPDGGRHGVAEAMGQVLWTDSPNQNVAGRWTTRPAQLGEHTLATGDLILLGLAAANDDPEVRPDDEAQPDPRAGSNAHFSFSHGTHRCPFPAQEIAEAIVRTGIDVLFERLPGLALDAASPPTVWASSPWRRGPTELPARFAPAPTVGA